MYLINWFIKSLQNSQRPRSIKVYLPGPSACHPDLHFDTYQDEGAWKCPWGVLQWEQAGGTNFYTFPGVGPPVSI